MLNETTDHSAPRLAWRSVLSNWGMPLLLVVAVVALTIVVARSSVDLEAIRAAARQGTLDALAAQSGNQPSVAAQPTVPLSMTIRPANRAGRADAPITIVEYSDFQCPYCGKFAQEVQPDLLKQYVETGQVAFVYKHMAILGNESTWAAEAAECAADQGKFWAYHDLLFAHQNGENQGAFNKDKLLGFAKDLSLDMTKFEPCLTNDEPLARVQADTQEGQAAGVRGTPTSFINGQPLVGAQPLASFRLTIDNFLAKK